MSESLQPRILTGTATREGNWWIITIPELGAVTQAHSVKEINSMATGLACALLDRDEDTLKVNVTIELPSEVADSWNAATTLHAEAEAVEKKAAALRRSAVRTLLSIGNMTQTDAAAVLGLSYQRVQQLAKASAE